MPREFSTHHLDIARELARAMGGEVDASSSAGGSTFTVRLPLARQAANTAS